MSRSMSLEEARAFLMHGTRTGMLAVPRKDGRPLVAPVWFLVDDDGQVVFMTGRDTVKGRSLVRDGRVSLCVDVAEPPYAFVRIDGVATVSEDLDEMLEWSIRIGARYMGEDRAEEYGRRNAVPGEMLVRIHPATIVARDDIAG